MLPYGVVCPDPDPGPDPDPEPNANPSPKPNPKPNPSPSPSPHRRYEYLLPYGVVCPGGDASEGEVVRTRQRLKALLRAFRGTKDFRHFTPRP